MKKQKRNLLLIEAFLILIIIFYTWFFTGDKIEKLCVKACDSVESDFMNFKESPTYNFVQRICLSETESRTLYFDLDTKEQLTSSDILGRVMS